MPRFGGHREQRRGGSGVGGSRRDASRLIQRIIQNGRPRLAVLAPIQAAAPGEVIRERLGVERGGHEHHPELRALAKQRAQEHQQKVGVDVALVHLVDHDVRHPAQARIPHQPSEQHARRHELDARALVPRRATVQTHAETDGVTRALAPLPRDSLGDGDGGYASRLRDDDSRVRPNPARDGVLEDVLRALGGLTAAGAAGHHHHSVRSQSLAELRPDLRDGQGFAGRAHLSLGAGGVRVRGGGARGLLGDEALVEFPPRRFVRDGPARRAGHGLLASAVPPVDDVGGPVRRIRIRVSRRLLLLFDSEHVPLHRALLRLPPRAHARVVVLRRPHRLDQRVHGVVRERRDAQRRDAAPG